jgi:four helix bundle protein
MATYQHFYELPVYRKCRFYRKKVTQLVKEKFSKEEKFLLTSQLLDACRSITANIAEGFGRYHHQENIQFCRQARGSLAETMDHLITAYDDQYISKEEITQINSYYKNCLKEINQYIKYLKAAKQQGAPDNQ